MEKKKEGEREREREGERERGSEREKERKRDCYHNVLLNCSYYHHSLPKLSLLTKKSTSHYNLRTKGFQTLCI